MDATRDYSSRGFLLSSRAQLTAMDAVPQAVGAFSSAALSPLTWFWREVDSINGQSPNDKQPAARSFVSLLSSSSQPFAQREDRAIGAAVDEHSISTERSDCAQPEAVKVQRSRFLRCTSLQLSALTFLPAAALAGAIGRWLGCAILLFVTLSSLVVHRGGRRLEVWEALDKLAIALWVAYNIRSTYHFSQRAMSLSEPSTEPWRLALLVLAVTGAVGVIVFDRRRRLWPKRSREHVARHAAMHVSGALGTLALLSTSIGAHDDYWWWVDAAAGRVCVA